MEKAFAPKKLKAAIRKAMSPSQRKSLDKGRIYAVQIIRIGKTLKRWGYDENPAMRNVATLRVQGKNCQILGTNLEERAWNWDKKKAFWEGVYALDYYVEGIRENYIIFIYDEENKRKQQSTL